MTFAEIILLAICLGAAYVVIEGIEKVWKLFKS